MRARTRIEAASKLRLATLWSAQDGWSNASREGHDPPRWTAIVNCTAGAPTPRPPIERNNICARISQ